MIEKERKLAELILDRLIATIPVTCYQEIREGLSAYEQAQNIVTRSRRSAPDLQTLPVDEAVLAKAFPQKVSPTEPATVEQKLSEALNAPDATPTETDPPKATRARRTRDKPAEPPVPETAGEPPSDAPAGSEEVPTPATAPEAATVTLDDITSIYSRAMKEFNGDPAEWKDIQNQFFAVRDKHKVAKLSDLKPELYAEVYAEFKAIYPN